MIGTVLTLPFIAKEAEWERIAPRITQSNEYKLIVHAHDGQNFWSSEFDEFELRPELLFFKTIPILVNRTMEVYGCTLVDKNHVPLKTAHFNSRLYLLPNDQLIITASHYDQRQDH